MLEPFWPEISYWEVFDPRIGENFALSRCVMSKSYECSSILLFEFRWVLDSRIDFHFWTLNVLKFVFPGDELLLSFFLT